MPICPKCGSRVWKDKGVLQVLSPTAAVYRWDCANPLCDIAVNIPLMDYGVPCAGPDCVSVN